MSDQFINDLSAYKDLRPFMKTGDMLEFRSNSFVGFMIRLFTRKKVNHTATVINIRYPGMEDRRFVVEALEHGIEMVVLSKRLERFKGEVYYTPVISDAFSGLEESEVKERSKIGHFMLNNLGTGYDYKSLFSNIFGAVSQDANRFFCSEFYQMALTSIGLLPKDIKALRPGEFSQFGIFGTETRII